MITDNKDCGHMVYKTHTTEGRLLGVMVPSKCASRNNLPFS